MPDSIQKDIILTIQEGGAAILRDSQSISFFGYFRVLFASRQFVTIDRIRDTGAGDSKKTSRIIQPLEGSLFPWLSVAITSTP